MREMSNTDRMKGREKHRQADRSMGIHGDSE